MRKVGQETEQTVEPELKDNGEQKVFTDDDLLFHWTSMCNRMPQEMAGMAARMKNMTPHIVQMPIVEVVVDNEILLNQMTAIKKRIRNTLARDLHNNQIELTLRLAEASEVTKILTKKELFEEMSRKNPAIERLRSLYDMELA